MKIERIKSYCLEKECNECKLHNAFGLCPFAIGPYNWASEEMKELQSALTDSIELLDAKETDGDKVENDSVNHPSHYCQDGSMECIDEMVEVFGARAVMNFCLCNIWKYRKRAMFKNGAEDMKKSDWYMKKFVELKEREEDGRE